MDRKTAFREESCEDIGYQIRRALEWVAEEDANSSRREPDPKDAPGRRHVYRLVTRYWEQ